MTITLTFDEIKDLQVKVFQWHTNYSRALVKYYKPKKKKGTDAEYMEWELFNKAYFAEYPMPKLLPNL